MLRHSIIIFFILCSFSCEYVPSKEYSVDLEPVPFGEITINLMEQPDTIILLTDSKFTYDILTNKNQNIHSTQVKFNDKFISGSNTTKGDFTLRQSDLGTGIHELKVEVTTSSGTGSLADIVGGEVLFYSRKWTVMTDKSNPEPLSITKIEKVNGQLRIEWQKNESFNFKSYEIYRNFYPYNENVTSSWMNDTITDANNNFYIDGYYIGGDVSFKVDNNSIYWKNSPGLSSAFSSASPKIKNASKQHGDIISVKWNKCLYENNFGKYELYNKTTGKLLYTTQKVNDTSFFFRVPFGGYNELKLTTYSKLNFYSQSDKLTYQFVQYAGDSLPRFDYMVHSNVPEIIYFATGGNFIRYSLVENKIIASIDLINKPVISPNGEILAYYKNQIISILDPLTLETTKTIDLSDYYSENYFFLLSVTNDGLLTIGKGFTEYEYTGGVYDINLNDTVFSFSGFGVPFRTSANNKYIVMSKDGSYKLYSFTNPLTYIGELSSHLYIFNPINEEELYFINEYSIELYSCADLNKIDQFKHNNPTYDFNIDPITGKILVLSYSYSLNNYQVLVLDFLKKTIEVTKQVFDPGGSNAQYLLFNNEIYSKGGFKLNYSE